MYPNTEIFLYIVVMFILIVQYINIMKKKPHYHSFCLSRSFFCMHKIIFWNIWLMKFHHYIVAIHQKQKKRYFYILHILHTCLSNAIQEGGLLPTASGNTLLVIFRVWPGNSSPPIPGLSSNSLRTLLLYPQICDLWKFSPPICQKCRRKREKKNSVFLFLSPW